MLKKLLTVVLPIALPFLIYGVYLLLARRRARLAGQGDLPGWQKAPWHWLSLAAVLLLAAGLITVREMGGTAPGEPIEPTRLEMKEEQRRLPVQ